jgi:hypothetical protein
MRHRLEGLLMALEESPFGETLRAVRAAAAHKTYSGRVTAAHKTYSGRVTTAI